MEEERLISSEEGIFEGSNDNLIRPIRLEDYIGQEKVKEQIDNIISAVLQY